MNCAVVLLSGGLDSTACLHWALGMFERVEALGFDYGQRHRDAELTSAHLLCQRRGVSFQVLHCGELARGHAALTVPVPGESNGISNANIPGRNAVLLAAAAAHAARSLRGQEVALVFGANADDARLFPDCAVAFVEAMSHSLNEAMRGIVHLSIAQPWREKTKVEVLRWMSSSNEMVEDARLSMSCYAGTRCGVCDACTLRASAFADCGIEDCAFVPRMCGGDPQRDASLGISK